jgi:hypothetical protein
MIFGKERFCPWKPSPEHKTIPVAKKAAHEMSP